MMVLLSLLAGISISESEELGEAVSKDILDMSLSKSDKYTAFSF